jgi:hypothetical protein
MSPVKRTLKALRDDYPLVEKVERWNPHAKCRQDLFGVADVLTIRPGETLAIQVTDASHAAAHEKNLD